MTDSAIEIRSPSYSTVGVRALSIAFAWTVRRNFWVSIGVASLGLVATMLLDMQFAPPAILILFFSTLAIYSIDDVFDEWIDSTRTRIPLLASSYTAIGVLVVSGLLMAAPPSTRVLIVTGGLICLCYSAPLPFRRLRKLKEIPVLKGCWIAGAVTCASVAVPLSYDPQHLGPAGDVLGLLLFLFVVTYANVQLFDIRDLRRDARQGVPTLPCLIGVERTRWLLYALIALTAAGLGVLALSGLVRVHLIYWFGLGGTLLLVALFRPNSPRLAFSLWVDGLLIVLGVMAYGGAWLG